MPLLYGGNWTVWLADRVITLMLFKSLALFEGNAIPY